VIPVAAERIESGTAKGDLLGFSGDLFSGWLERTGDGRLYLHCIISRKKNEGNTQGLIRHWMSLGYDLRVVMPRPIMRHILGKFGFEPSWEFIPVHYEYPVEVWCRSGACRAPGALPEPIIAGPR
jgi:hypothetical protein